jgi:hypothetical protein
MFDVNVVFFIFRLLSLLNKFISIYVFEKVLSVCSAFSYVFWLILNLNVCVAIYVYLFCIMVQTGRGCVTF